MSGTIDFYVVLGIAEEADEETIRSAFRALARRYHPDAGAGSSAVEFQRARAAYETLVDPERRRQYDRQLRASRNHAVVVREVNVRPFAEPLRGSRRSVFGVPLTFVMASPPPFIDELVEEFFAPFDEDRFWPRRRW